MPEIDYSHVPGCHEPTDDIEREIDAIVGRFTLKDWRDLSEHWRTTLLPWLRKVEAMSDLDLYWECRVQIMDSARMNRFRNMNHVHFQADACMAISRRRRVAAGHDQWCRASIYNRAHKDLGHELFDHERVEGCDCETED